jgi:hypothetical protein
VIPSIRLFFNLKSEKIINEVTANLTIVSYDVNSIAKELSKLLKFIEETLAEFKLTYKKYEQ